MKKVLLSLLLMLVTLTVFSQEELKFSKVIQSESEADKTTLYSTLRSFISTYFHDSKQVIQMDDKDAGIIICKATSIFNSPSLMLSAYEGWIDYNLKLQARDGRVRIEVFHFFHHNKPGNQAKAQLGILTTAEEYANSGIQKKYHNKVWLLLKEQAEDISNKVFAGIEKAMKEGATINSQEEEW
ncbi:DUF4468 domain-containing protein [Bacteroides nordii]|jgi:hypothetical protein|uniref:DUF4468 domain-containing protein n=1 Tax=Bacteroides nordii TaxID=291645 RepID=UPI0009E05E74|nr:DUF4468 domain-containing protein [Bacteroides nordii]UAK40949.1 DUF4468 domain-containing protein [Bacteroides nordii]